MTTAATAPKTNAQTTPAVRPACRPPAAWLLAWLLAGIGASASALDVTFCLQPADSVVVEGHAIAFLATGNLNPSSFFPPAYQWYRNGVALPGATSPYYRFTAQRGDDGARYHVVAQGEPLAGKGVVVQGVAGMVTPAANFAGPTASSAATLTVLPAGSSLTPQITAPETLYLQGNPSEANEYINFRWFRAIGNDLQWSYRFSSDPPTVWRDLSTDTNGIQATLFDIGADESVSLTVRVIDDSGTCATRTWQLAYGPEVNDVIFFPPPGSATVVEGHAVTLAAGAALDPDPPPAYQWYRNDAVIAGATARTYRFTAQLADDAARYHVVAQGMGSGKVGHVGPTASLKATLTVLPAGSSLAPAITTPPGDTLVIPATATVNSQVFEAIGNDLQWAYRFDSEPADQWHVLSADTNGAHVVVIDITPAGGASSITVRVIDDAGVSASRTWWFAWNQSPTIASGPVATPSTVVYPGPVTLSCTATDPDGDSLTYTWRKRRGYGNVTFVPNGTTDSATVTATFGKFGTYELEVEVRDGRGGRAGTPEPGLMVTVTSNFDTRADLNNDGVVNALDLGILLDNFGAVVP